MQIDLYSQIPHIHTLMLEYNNLRTELEKLVQKVDTVNPNHDTYSDTYKTSKKMDSLKTLITQCILIQKKPLFSAWIDTEETICLYTDRFDKEINTNLNLDIFQKNILSSLDGAGFRYRNIILGIVNQLDSITMETLLNNCSRSNYKFYFIYPVEYFMNSFQCNFLYEINRENHVKADSIVYIASGNESMNYIPELLKQMGQLHITYTPNGKMSIFQNS